MAVFHSKPFRDGAELDKSETFVQVARMSVAFDNGIELQDSKSVLFSLFKAVLHEHFADMLASGFWRNRIACIRNVTATAHVVRVQNVQAENFAFFFGNGAVGLCRKELLACFGRERLLLRKDDAAV